MRLINHPACSLSTTPFLLYIKFQGGSGTEPELETGTAGTVFPGTERAGTAGTVFQQPQPEPPLSVKLYWNRRKRPPQRNHQNRKPEPLEPFQPQTNRAKPNRGHPEVFALSVSVSPRLNIQFPDISWVARSGPSKSGLKPPVHGHLSCTATTH